MELSLLSSAAKSLLGGLAFELFTAAVHFSDTIMQLILWVLIAVLLCMKVSKFSNRGRSELLIA